MLVGSSQQVRLPEGADNLFDLLICFDNVWAEELDVVVKEGRVVIEGFVSFVVVSRRPP